MKLTLDSSATIAQIKKEFHESYPFLKVEFYSKSHDAYKVSPAKFIVHDETTQIKNLAKEGFTSGSLDIGGSVTVKQFESAAEELYGIHIQVLRKSGHSWLATTVTDNLTLEEQNQKGESSTEEHEPEDKMDYREQD